MITKQLRWAAVLLLLGAATGTSGQSEDKPAAIVEPCNCSGSVAAAVIITTIVVLILATLFWCYSTHKKKKNEVKPDPEAASRAAYDNPQFQGDELDLPHGTNQAHTVQSPDAQFSAKVASTATNTTSTLERGKSTLERVINAVIRGNRSGLDKRTKDDHSMGTKQIVAVPLQGHDFTGLGFTVHGNITQGVYVKEVMSRGPASQSGQIVPGDKVLAITVLTNHIVQEDVSTILSYASPYPVIVNVEKGSGPISGFSTLNSKSKLNTSAPSVALIHPSFKTQSCADFSKIKTVDVSRLKIGQNAALPPKGKVPSVNIASEIAKVQKINYVQRSGPDRHSERAIDVPGVDVKVKLPDVKLDIENLDQEDEPGLANIQVHRPMSPSVDVSAPHMTIVMPQFEDSKLSEASEKLESSGDINVKGPKFGVKVFPDINFLKKSSNIIDMEPDEIELKQPSNPERKGVLAYEQKNKTHNINDPSFNSTFKLTMDKEPIDTKILSSEHTLELKETIKQLDTKVGLGFKGFSNDIDIPRKSEEKVDLNNAEIILPSLEVIIKQDEEPEIQNVTNNTKEEKHCKKSKNSFKIGMPDINLPSFGMKRGTKHEKESPVSEEEDDKQKSKSKSFKFGLPSFELGSRDSKGLEKTDVKDNEIESPLIEKTDTNESKGKYDLKLETPGISIPSLDLKSKDQSGQNKFKFTKEENHESSINTKLKASVEVDSEVSIDKSHKLKTDLNTDLPDGRFPQLDEIKVSDGEVEESKKSSKKGFSINAPDINLPSLNIKLKNKKSVDNQEDNENNGNKKKTNTKSGFKIEAPDISIPSFSMKKRKSKDYNADEITISSQSTETEKVCSDTEVSLPDINLQSEISTMNLDVDANLENQEEKDKKEMGESKKSKKEKKKSKEKSGFNFKFKTADFSFPNFGNKNPNKEIDGISSPTIDDIKIKSNIEEPKIDVEIEEKSSAENQFALNMNTPEMSLPNIESSVGINQLKSEFLQEQDVNVENIIKVPIVEAVRMSENNYKISSSEIEGITTKEMSISDVELNLNLDTQMDVNELKEFTDISSPSINIPDFKIPTNLDIDQEYYLDIDGAEASSQEIVEVTEKAEMDFDFSIPSFETPFAMKINEKHSNINIDEIKVDASGRRAMESFEIQTMSEEIYLEHPEILAKDIKIPQISSPDLGFEDDKSKNGKHERGGSSDYEMSIKLPEISQLKWSVKSNSSYEDSSTSKNVSLDSNLPDIDTDLLDDESSEDLNITDATKKKRFGYKIRSPDLVVPEFLSSSLPAEEEDKDLIDGNQSDEMKSFNLKLKVPNVSEGATAVSTEPQIDYDDIDEVIVKLPRVKVSSIKSKVSSDKMVDTSIHPDLIGNIPKKIKFNKSDEWKMKGSESKELDFSTANETPEDERDNTFNIDIDDADFVIPDIKSIPGYDINNLPDFELFDTKNIQASSSSTVEYALPEFDIKERRKIFEDGAKLSDEKIEIEVTKKDYLPDFQIDIAKSKFLNLSLESSELESDLPEADSDLKRVTSNISEIDVVTDASINKDSVEATHSFGNAFGFRGFKKHIEREEILGREKYNAGTTNNKNDSLENTSLTLDLTEKDLPEVDIHLDMQGQLESIKQERKLIKIEKSTYNKLLAEKTDSSDSEPKADDNSTNNITKTNDDSNKPKSKTGMGFGYKNFGKLSDSEDNESGIKVFIEPERITQDVKEKSRPKAKKTFSFKGLVGRSSSDTEEENTGKVSENPMMDDSEEKVKLRNKNSLTFGFKQRSSKNSDSEENLDSEKVEINPHVDASSKKQKTKSNLSFGFINKTKSEVEVIPQSDVQTKEMKYENKSESEGGEDERPSMDSRTDEGRGKSKYGLNFGFRKGNQKNSSDSEGVENDENQINLDERGASDKNKEQKGKSLKLGFKGFKNLKGKIQNEINKMRHDSPSTDEDEKREEQIHGEKRKKLPKKKEKDKKFKRESDCFMDASEEAAITSAGLAAKESRRKRISSKSSISASSSSDSSSDDEDKVVELKKKKKTKSKRKEEIRLVTSGATYADNALEVDERITISERPIDVEFSSIKLPSSEATHITVIKSEPTDHIMNKDVHTNQNKDVESNPRRYVVVREMKLKKSPVKIDIEEVHEDIEKMNIDKKYLQPIFIDDKAAFTNSGTDTDGANWGSDSDMERRTDGINLSESSVNFIINKNHRHLTDSEELKRKATSLGDLSTLHEGAGMSTVLERAVSLDLKSASVEHPPLHIRRLQLPDSSATSIDEIDEPLTSSSPKKLDSNFGLKAASQWGTLEEALRLGIRSNENVSTSSQVTTTFVRNASVEQGEPVSNIEISGDPSVTTLSVNKNNWSESYEDDSPPSLPSSPVPVAPTTIAVKEEVLNKILETVTTDSSIVVIGSDEIERANNIHNVNVVDDHVVDDSSMVTITMVPAESHRHINIVSPPVNKLKQGLNSTLPSELTGFNIVQDASIVTVNHDSMYENGELVSESSDHSISDDFMTPDATPQKSMTQITLEGDGGYTVTEGTISRTVILTSPEVEPTILVQTDGRDTTIPR